jgi:hypothetical protein
MNSCEDAQVIFKLKQPAPAYSMNFSWFIEPLYDFVITTLN